MVAALAAVTAFGIVGCLPDSSAGTGDSEGGSKGTPVNFSVIESGQHAVSGDLDLRRLEVYDDQASFNESFFEFSNSGEYPVDFSAKRVVLMSLGKRSTGGYEIAATDVRDMETHVTVFVEITRPGDGCVVTQSATSPYQFIEIATVRTVTFEETLTVTECP